MRAVLQKPKTNVWNYFIWCLSAVVFIFLIIFPSFDFKLSYVFYILFWITMAASLNIIYGLTGYLPFGFVAFYGVGGYAAAFFMKTFHLSPYISLVLAGVAGVILALLFFPTLRLKGVYFAIVSFACAFFIKSIITNLPSEYFGGSDGISLTSFYNPKASYYCMLLLTLIVIVVSFLIMRSRMGIALKSIKHDQESAEVCGINSTRVKLYAWVIGATFPAIAGAIDTWNTAVIDPDTGFNMLLTTKAIIYGMFGGFGTLLGPIIGTFTVYQIDDFVWAHFPTMDTLLLGLILLLLIMYLPNGIIGTIHRKFPKSRFFLR